LNKKALNLKQKAVRSEKKALNSEKKTVTSEQKDLISTGKNWKPGENAPHRTPLISGETQRQRAAGSSLAV
jgi:hypothetical protein